MNKSDSTYAPPSVIRFLHERKRSYYTNQLKANGLICLLLLCLLAGQLLLSRYYGTETNGTSSDIINPAYWSSARPRQPGKPFEVGGVWISSGSLVIVSDTAPVEIGYATGSIAIEEPELEIGYPGLEPVEGGFGYGGYDNDGYDDDGYDDDGYDDHGLPPEETFFDMRIPGKQLPQMLYIANAAAGQMQRDRGITINKNDVRNHTPRFPVRALKCRIDSGVVKLAVTIDEKGNIKRLKLLEEDPAGYGFADALREINVINRWRITPPFIDGQSVGCTFPLTYVFCRDCPVEVHVQTPAFALTTSPSPR